MLRLTPLIPLLLVGVLVSCERSPLKPTMQENREMVVDGVRVRLTLEPEVVETADSFTVRVSFTNLAQDTAVWVNTTPECLIGGVEVLAGEENARFQGSGGNACRVEPAERPMLPGESLERTWTVVAQTHLGRPVNPGQYLVSVGLGNRSHTEPYPLLRHRLVVR